MKTELTLSQRLQQFRAPRVVRAMITVGVILLICGVAYGVVEGGPTPPNPPWTLRGWLYWWNADPNAALVALCTAASNVAALVFGAYPVLWSKDAKKAGEGIESIEAGIERIEKIVRGLAAARASDAPAPTADSVARTEHAAEELVRSDDAADQRAADLISNGEVAAGLAILSNAALAADRDAAERWRRLGALAYSVNVAAALDAFSRAAERDPADFWTQVYVARLCAALGRTERREQAAHAAVGAATDAYERYAALLEIGDALSARDDVPGALLAYHESLGIARELAAEDPTTERLRDISVGLDRIGSALSASNDLSGALAAYQDGLTIRRKLAADDPTAERLRDVSVSLEGIGDVLSASDDRTGALEAYQHGLATRRKLAADNPTGRRLRDVCVSLNKIGNVLSDGNHLTSALAAYRESLGIARKLVAADPTNAERLRDVSVSLEGIGDVLSAGNHLTGALATYQNCLCIARELIAADPTNAERLRDLSASLDRIGNVLSARNDLTGALAAYQESLGVARKLAADPTNAEGQIRLGVSLFNLARTAERQGDLRLAGQLFAQASDLFGGLSIRAPDHHQLKVMADAAANDAARVAALA